MGEDSKIVVKIDGDNSGLKNLKNLSCFRLYINFSVFGQKILF